MKVKSVDLENKTAVIEAFGETRTVTIWTYRDEDHAMFSGFGFRIGRSGTKIWAGSAGIARQTDPAQARKYGVNVGEWYFIKPTAGLDYNGGKYTTPVCWYNKASEMAKSKR